MRQQSGREDRVQRGVPQRQPSRVGQYEPTAAAPSGLRQHLDGHVDGDHRAGRSDRRPQRLDGPAGAAGGIEHGPGDRHRESSSTARW
nr:hypothetical protein [Fodinicola feengrottensis]